MSCTEPCEIVEAYVEATSVTPTAEVVIVALSTGAASDLATPGVTLPVLISSGAASNVVVTAEAFTLATGSVEASTLAVNPSTTVTSLLITTASTESFSFASASNTEISTAAAVSTVVLADVPMLLVSTAAASSVATPDRVTELLLLNNARAASSVEIGLLESVIGTADVSSVATPLRTLELLNVGTADASSVATPASTVSPPVLLSTLAASNVALGDIDANQLALATALAESTAVFKDPNRIAWVMNTESTAASVYTNFDFVSVSQTPDKILALGEDGLYELTGDTDSGEEIDAVLRSGMHDFGFMDTKRIADILYGYTSDGALTVTLETTESGHSPYTYSLEDRNALSPRNTRVIPGKGLRGRYWRWEFRNVSGADFKVTNVVVSLARSARRI